MKLKVTLLYFLRKFYTVEIWFPSHFLVFFHRKICYFWKIDSSVTRSLTVRVFSYYFEYFTIKRRWRWVGVEVGWNGGCSSTNGMTGPRIELDFTLPRSSSSSVAINVDITTRKFNFRSTINSSDGRCSPLRKFRSNSTLKTNFAFTLAHIFEKNFSSPQEGCEVLTAPV